MVKGELSIHICGGCLPFDSLTCGNSEFHAAQRQHGHDTRSRGEPHEETVAEHAVRPLLHAVRQVSTTCPRAIAVLARAQQNATWNQHRRSATLEGPAEDVARFREVLPQVLEYGRPDARPVRVGI